MQFIFACQVLIVLALILLACVTEASFMRAIALGVLANLTYFLGFLTAVILGASVTSCTVSGAIAAVVVLCTCRILAPDESANIPIAVWISCAVFFGIALTPITARLNATTSGPGELAFLLAWPLGVLFGALAERFGKKSSLLHGTSER